MRSQRPVVKLIFGALALASIAAQSPARVEMVLAIQPGAAPTASQEWYKLLTDLAVDSVVIHSARDADKPDIVSGGGPAAPIYKVVGLVSRSGELTVPGGRFRTADRARLGEWLAKLRREGAARAGGGPRLLFGLAKEQLLDAREDLSRAVDWSTLGQQPAALVDQVADKLRFPLTGDSASAALLGAAGPLDIELRGLAVGTTLAFVLDRQGLALVPVPDARRQLAYTISAARGKAERWPIGWPAQRPKRELLPAIFDTVDVEITGVELPRVLAAVGEHVAVPLLIDQPALAAEKIDLSKIKVSLPTKRSMYEIVLGKALVPNLLIHDIRVDEADKPFVWITTARKASAEKAKGATK